MGISSVLQFSVSLLAATAVNASPLLNSRGEISHDGVVGFPETVPGGIIGDVYEAYQPFLKVVNGCVPFAAVDAAGNTGYVTHSIRHVYIYISCPTSNNLLQWWPQAYRR